jgi:hypothetical protein
MATESASVSGWSSPSAVVQVDRQRGGQGADALEVSRGAHPREQPVGVAQVGRGGGRVGGAHGDLGASEAASGDLQLGPMACAVSSAAVSAASAAA